MPFVTQIVVATGLFNDTDKEIMNEIASNDRLPGKMIVSCSW